MPIFLLTNNDPRENSKIRITERQINNTTKIVLQIFYLKLIEIISTPSITHRRHTKHIETLEIRPLFDTSMSKIK